MISVAKPEDIIKGKGISRIYSYEKMLERAIETIKDLNDSCNNFRRFVTDEEAKEK